MIDIKDISGNIRYSTLINDGCKRKFLLMKEDCITLKFNLDNPINFKLGDWVDDPDFGLFELCDLQKPTYNSSTGGYDYELRFDAYYWKWKNKIFKFTPEEGGQEASWNLTATLDKQMGVFLRNLKSLDYKFKGTDFMYFIDITVDKDSAKLMAYDKTNLIDALNKMAEAWECEWWIKKETIHFGRCESGDPVDFELGKNVESMTRSDSQTNFATRIYAFGSTRNIPPTYRKKLVFDVKKVNSRDISDTARPLDIEFFPPSQISKEVLKGKIDLDSIVLNEAREATCVITNKIIGGVYHLQNRSVPIVISGIISGGSTEYYPPVGTYNYLLDFRYTKDGVEKKIQGASGSHYHGDKNVNGFEDTLTLPSTLSIEKGAVNLEAVLTVSAQTSTQPRGVSAKVVSFNLTLENSTNSINLSLTFSTGKNKDQTYSAIYNPDFLTGDAANIIRLPEGITASLGDRFTINNIVKSKVPAGYFSNDSSDTTVEGIVSKHLMLPEGINYIDSYEGMTQEEAVEEVVVFDDIFAQREGVVGEVIPHQYTDIIENADGSKTETNWNAYRFKDADLGFHFSKEYILPTGLMVDFQTGSLAGMTFEVLFNNYDKAKDPGPQPEKNDDGTWNPYAQVYEIKRNDDYGRMLPDDVLKPNNTDKYILHGYDTAFVDESLMPDAETKLYERAKEYASKSITDPSTYDCSMMSDYIFGIDPETGEQDKAYANSFTVGSIVKLINPAYFQDGRQSRIIGFEYKLDISYDTPVYTVGETAPYSRLGELEGKIDSISKKDVIIKNTTTNNNNTSGGSGGTSKDKLSFDIRVTSPQVGYINPGDVFPIGTFYEEIFVAMLSKKAVASLKRSISTPNDVEFGSNKGVITYTAIQNNNGPMKEAYYDSIKTNILNFSESVGGVQTATRQLTGIYTQKETYIATVVFSESQDKTLPELPLTDTISVNVRRKWFAGVCNAVPTTSPEVRALASSGLYTGAGTYKFNTSDWKIVVVCIPTDTVKEISIASSYGNFVENGKVCTGPTEILVEGANGSEAIKYKMWVIQTSGTNDPDSFTFKTI